MPLSEVDQARFDNLARQCSNIDKELADEMTRPALLTQMQPAIDQMKTLYDAYPPEAQAAVRNELMPRLYFSWDTGYEKCPHCVRGMVSPDREEFITQKDAQGNTIYKEQHQVLHDPEGNIMMGVDNQPMTKVVLVADERPVAIEKEQCKHCTGTGERLVASVAA